jgi:hypothetical protein
VETSQTEFGNPIPNPTDGRTTSYCNACGGVTVLPSEQVGFVPTWEMA